MGARQQVERHHIRGVIGIGNQGALNGVLGLDLAFGAVKADFERALLERQARCREASTLEGFFHFGLHAGIDLDGRLAR